MDTPDFGTPGTSGSSSRSTEGSSSWGDDAARQAGRIKDKVSEGIDYAAGQVRDQVDHTVKYFKNHDTKQMLNDVTSFVKSHPAQALVGAVVVGFVAARLLRK